MSHVNRALWTSLLVFTFGLPAGTLPAEACGPYYAVPLLAGYGARLSDVPQSRFERELEAWAARGGSGFAARAIGTRQAEEEEAPAALSAEQARIYLERRASKSALPDDLPAEWVLYQRAALALHAGDVDLARDSLRAVLDLPPESRRHRSTWAAYMLGAIESDPAVKLDRLRQVRSLAGEGYSDSLGLAAASFRREADELPSASSAQRLEACGRYVQSGGRHFCALDLRGMTRPVLTDPAELRKAASLEAAASLVTLAWTSRLGWGGDEAERAEARAWLAHMESSPHAAGLEGRLAWIAYGIGDGATAEAWAARADEHDAVAHWIAAKLRLQAGDLDAAGERLVQAAGQAQVHVSCDHHHAQGARAIQAELGVVRLAQDRPVEAMEAFLDAHNWMDAAWIGEKVLTTDELQALVDRRAPFAEKFEVITEEAPTAEPVAGASDDALPTPAPVTTRLDVYEHSGYLPMLLDGEDADPKFLPALLRGLLGRRLVREGRLVDARPYLPIQARPHLDQIVNDLQIGRDPATSKHERAAALWRAAFTTKMEGWALSATELEPDQRVLGGWYPGADTEAQRVGSDGYFPDRGLRPSSEERGRLDAQADPPGRYHFVWTADGIAREALDLMDADHPDLPQAACVTGHWMKHRSAERAWASWMLIQERLPDHPLHDALKGRTGWWSLNEEGLCDLPDGTPLAAESSVCSTTATQAGWWVALLGLWGLGTRRRRVD